MEKFKALNELNIKITNNDKTLVDENCCTAITISLNNEGNVFTSFVGEKFSTLLSLMNDQYIPKVSIFYKSDRSGLILCSSA